MIDLQTFFSNHQTEKISWTEFITNTSSKDLVRKLKAKKELVTVAGNDGVGKVMGILKNSKISSAPVIDNKGKVLGIIDMLDLTAFCSIKFGTRVQFGPDDFPERQMQEFLDTPVKELFDLSGRNEWHSLPEDSSLLRLIDTLAHPNVHRVAITDTNGKGLLAVVSRSNIVDFLYENRKFIEDKLGEKVGQFCLDNYFHVEGIQSGDLLIEGFRTIWEKKVCGIAVLDKAGTLIGCLSANDLKRVNFTTVEHSPLNFPALYQPIRKFMQTKAIEKGADQYTITKDITVGTLLELSATSHIHRFFVSDTMGKPIAVVSQSDILKQFLPPSSD
jgi:CBS domain-containing protein